MGISKEHFDYVYNRFRRDLAAGNGNHVYFESYNDVDVSTLVVLHFNGLFRVDYPDSSTSIFFKIKSRNTAEEIVNCFKETEVMFL